MPERNAMSAARTIVTADKKPGPQPDIIDIHTLSVFVNNKPGVLARIAQTFSRRGFNIDSLVVSQGRDGRFSRMTIGVTGDPKLLNQIVEQVNKLIDVINCH
jgi:acetolactate synthase-1/3 small subunit